MKTTLTKLRESKWPNGYKNYALRHSLACILYGEKCSMMNSQIFERFIDKHQDEIEIPEYEDAMNLIAKVNKMVKDESCPNNIRNRFYAKKHKFITFAYAAGEVDKVTGDDKVIGFYFKNGMCLHQPIFWMNKWLEKKENADSVQYEKYDKDGLSIPFDEETYKQCMIGMVSYAYKFEELLNVVRKNKK